jgi:hypothetical protein
VEVARDYDVDVTLTQEAKGDLLRWNVALLRFRDSQVWRGKGAKVLKQLTSASGDGWGCTIEEYGEGVVDYNNGLFSRVPLRPHLQLPRAVHSIRGHKEGEGATP